MARPTTKSDLITVANSQFDKMWKLIDSVSEAGGNVVFSFSEEFIQKQKEAHWGRDKDLKDILIHLYEWHQLLLAWVAANQQGEPKPFLPEPYNWKTYGAMNIEFWKKHRATPYAKAKEMLFQSHREVMALIERFSDTELFKKQHFTWTGTSSLGSYCISATSSHYDWAIKKLKQHLKAIG